MKALVDITKSTPSDQPATIRVPEVEKGVGCDFDSYLLVPDNTLDARIDASEPPPQRRTKLLTVLELVNVTMSMSPRSSRCRIAAASNAGATVR